MNYCVTHNQWYGDHCAYCGYPFSTVTSDSSIYASASQIKTRIRQIPKKPRKRKRTEKIAER